MNYTPVPFEFLDEMEDLTDEEFGRLIRWGLRYQSTGEVLELQGNERLFRKRIQNQIDRYVTNYEKKVAQCREAGRVGGQRKAANASENKQAVTDASERLANASGEKAETAPEKKHYGIYVQLTLQEYNILLQEMGFTEFIRCKSAVDVESNQGKDWSALIRAKHEEGRT